MKRMLLLVGGMLLLVTFSFLGTTKERSSVTPDLSETPLCPMDALVCPDGTTLGRTNPDCSFPTCPPAAVEKIEDDFIAIDTPTKGMVVSSPITISGKARGNWFFEGSFPIIITNWDGLIVGEGYATADGDWMTTEFVPFTGTVTYTVDPETPYDRGFIIFKKDNPSGLPEYDDAREFEIFFGEIPQLN